MPSPARSPRRWLPDRRVAVVLALLATSVALSGCSAALGTRGSGTVVDSRREVPDFGALAVDAGLAVSLVVGDTSGVVVRADDNVQQLVTAEVTDGTLTLDVSGRVSDATLEATVTVPADALTEVTLDGAASLTDTDPLASAELTVSLDGAARAFVVVDAGTLRAQAAGASVLNAAGTAQELDVRADGASSVQMRELTTPVATVQAHGGSRASVTVTQRLDAAASGASEITYGGGPESVEQDAEAGSTIRAE